MASRWRSWRWPGCSATRRWPRRSSARRASPSSTRILEPSPALHFTPDELRGNRPVRFRFGVDLWRGRAQRRAVGLQRSGSFDHAHDRPRIGCAGRHRLDTLDEAHDCRLTAEQLRRRLQRAAAPPRIAGPACRRRSAPSSTTNAGRAFDAESRIIPDFFRRQSVEPTATSRKSAGFCSARVTSACTDM